MENEKVITAVLISMIIIGTPLLFHSELNKPVKIVEPDNLDKILLKYYWVDNCTGTPEHIWNGSDFWKPKEIYLPLTHQCLKVYNCTKDHCLTRLCSSPNYCSYCYDEYRVIELDSCQTNRIMKGSFEINLKNK